MKVIIVSPEKILYEGEAESVKVPGEKGQFEILKGHAPIISTLLPGTITCRGSENFEVQAKSGFVEVAADEVSVCIEN